MRILKISFSIITIALIVTSCMYKDISIGEVRNLSIDEFTGEGMKMEANVFVSNPNFYDINISHCDVDLFINDNHVGEAYFEESFLIPSNYEDDLLLTFRAKFNKNIKKNMRELMKMAFGEPLPIKIKGEVTGKAFFFEKSHEIEIAQKVKIQ